MELRSQSDQLIDAERALTSERAERERSASARRKEHERYRDLLDFASDALIVTDKRGQVREANLAAGRLLGVPARSVRGRNLAAFLRRADRQDFRHALAAIATGAAVALEVVVDAMPDGDPRVELHGQMARNDRRVLWRGRPACEEGESELPPPSVEHVEVAVARRTKALEGALRDKDRLLDRERQSRAELETASNAKDRSIAILSHELRAPVHAILGWTKLLRQADIAVDARERGLAVIERNALAQAELVETLLDLSRIAANKMTLSQTPVDFADVVSFAVDTLRPEACRKRIALSSEIHRNVPVFGDALRLQQVAMNLVGNALRYTQPGGWVGVRVERSEAQAELVVADSGRGVAAELMPRIFDCFHQGGEHPGQGLGLGLYLVRKFVEMHGGTVWAESDGENRGATFTVRLPARAGAEPGSRALV